MSSTPSAFSVGGASINGGAMVFIQSQTANSSSTITFSGLNSNYIAYKLIIANLTPSNTAANINLQLNGDSSSNYNWAWQAPNASGSTYSGGASAASAIQLIAGSAKAGVEITIYNPSNSGNCFVNYNVSNYNGSSLYVDYQGGGNYLGSGPVTSFTISASSGSITSGTFTLYGIAASTGVINGGPVLLSTYNVASNVTSIPFINLPSSTAYSKLQLVGTGILTTGTDTVLLQFSSNNGSSYITTGYYYSYNYVYSNNTNGAYGAGIASAIDVVQNIWNSSYPLNFTMDFYGMNVAAGTYGNVAFNVVGSFGGSYPANASGQGMLFSSSNVINAFKLSFGTYQFSAGTFYLYGLPA